MAAVAEGFRYILISEQIFLILWMLSSDLWRRLPLWTLWLTVEAISRIPFTPGGNYWHHVWLPLQPALLFLLASSAAEAKYQSSGVRLGAVAAVALCIAPIGVGLQLSELVTMRAWVNFGVAAMLAFSPGSFTARWHARTLSFLAAFTAMLGWIPATGTDWWRMRVGYLGVYCVLCGFWFWLFNRGADRSIASEF